MLETGWRIPWLRSGGRQDTEAPAPVARKTARGGFVVAEARPRCCKCRKPIGPADKLRCGSCGVRLETPPEAEQAAGQPGDDERQADECQAPVIGRHRELSLLTEMQKRMLVAALHGDRQRTARALASGFREGIGVEIGTERFGGREALEAMTSLLAAGYFRRTEPPFLGLTFRGQLLADMVSWQQRR